MRKLCPHRLGSPLHMPASLHVVTLCKRSMLLAQVLLVADNVAIPLLHCALVHHPNLVGHLEQ